MNCSNLYLSILSFVVLRPVATVIACTLLLSIALKNLQYTKRRYYIESRLAYKAKKQDLLCTINATENDINLRVIDNDDVKGDIVPLTFDEDSSGIFSNLSNGIIVGRGTFPY